MKQQTLDALMPIVNSDQVLIVGYNQNKPIAAAAKIDVEKFDGVELKDMTTAFFMLIINLMKESGTNHEEVIATLGSQLGFAIKKVYAEQVNAASTAVHSTH